jgi:hypothetical protein
MVILVFEGFIDEKSLYGRLSMVGGDENKSEFRKNSE